MSGRCFTPPRLVAIVLVALACASAQAADAVAAMKTPLSYSLEQYGLVLAVSFFSGLASWLAKVRKGLVPVSSLSSLLGESLTSVIAGLMTFWLAEWQELNQLLTISLVALAGHAGGKTLMLAEGIAQRRLARLVADDAGHPAPPDHGGSKITIATLIAAGIAPTQARTFAEPLAAAAQRFGIDRPARLAGFIGQCNIESTGFTELEESLFYRSPERIGSVFKRLRGRGPDGLLKLVRNPKALGNAAYAKFLGNGDEASGDGWRYRGRGLKMLTGLDNYRAAENGTGRPYIAQPDLVAQPVDACLAAAWFWHANGCNALADSAQWDAITRVVNGPAELMKVERRSAMAEALRAFQ